MLKRTIFALPLLATACSDDSTGSSGVGGSPSCTLEYLGSVDSEITLELEYADGDGKKHALTAGGPLPLVFPPQGGRVSFVSARMTNLDPCGVQITGALRDIASNQVRLDGRTINLTPEGNGFGASSEGDISSFANIPVCPNQWSETTIYDNEFTLEFDVKDRDGKTAKVVTKVVPTCAQPELEEECRCQCKAGYVLGEICQGTGGQGGSGGNTGGAGGAAQ